MRTKTTIAGLAVALSLMTAAEASALDILRGRGADPVGDSRGGPLQDLTVVEGQFDPNAGTLSAIATVDASSSGHGSSAPLLARTVITITFGVLDAAGTCPAGTGASATFRAGESAAVWHIDGAAPDISIESPGGPPQLSVSSVLFNQPALTGRDLNCVSASLTSGEPATLQDSTPVVPMPPLVYTDGKDPSIGEPQPEPPAAPIAVPTPTFSRVSDALIISKRVQRRQSGFYVNLRSRKAARDALKAVRVTAPGGARRSFTGVQLADGVRVKLAAHGPVKLRVVAELRNGTTLVDRARTVNR